MEKFNEQNLNSLLMKQIFLKENKMGYSVNSIKTDQRKDSRSSFFYIA